MKLKLVLFTFLTLTRFGMAVEAYCEFARCSDETVQFYGAQFVHSFKAAGKLYDIEATDKLRALGLLQATEHVKSVVVTPVTGNECVFPKPNLTETNTCTYREGKLGFAVYDASNQFVVYKTLPIQGYIATQTPDEGEPKWYSISLDIQLDTMVLKLGGALVDCYFKE